MTDSPKLTPANEARLMFETFLQEGADAARAMLADPEISLQGLRRARGLAREARTKIEGFRAELIAPALEYQRAVNASAKAHTDKAHDIEEEAAERIKVLESEKEARRAERQKRSDAIVEARAHALVEAGHSALPHSVLRRLSDSDFQAILGQAL